jgi:hypothetical protein
VAKPRKGKRVRDFMIAGILRIFYLIEIDEDEEREKMKIDERERSGSTSEVIEVCMTPVPPVRVVQTRSVSSSKSDRPELTTDQSEALDDLALIRKCL